MLGLTLPLGFIVLALHMAAVCLSRALRTYSRSRLEDLCGAHGRPKRVLEIAHQDQRTERAAEGLATLSGLILAALLGATAAHLEAGPRAELMALAAVLVAALGHIIAAVLGRVHAESVLDRAWPFTGILRRVMTPWTWLARLVEAIAYRRSPWLADSPRPASVEVEVHSADLSEEDTLDAELTEGTRELLEKVVEMTRKDIRTLFTPRSKMRFLAAAASPAEAARAFIESGLSRIPVFGENRDDIIGVLYAKDLFARLFDPDIREAVSPRKLARPPVFVPETKHAAELLDEFRAKQFQLAIVLDEYGTIAGLITLEDLIEYLVGPIHDEHDHEPAPVREVNATTFDIDAALPIEEVNDRLDLALPTDEDYSTIGGLVLATLGHVPENGTTFESHGLKFTVTSVAGHAIRRLNIERKPAKARAAAGPLGKRHDSSGT